MQKRFLSLPLVALVGVLAGCEDLGAGAGAGAGASDERITALETELGTLREEFTAFQGQWDGFYQDWGTYREQIGLGGDGAAGAEGGSE